MDLSLIFISALLIAFIFIPIFLLISSGNSDQKRIVKEFNLIAKANNLDIKTKEVWGQKMIGIDVAAKKLLFVSATDSELSNQLIDLSNIQKCESVIIFSKEKNEEILEKVVLKINFKNSTSPSLDLLFYDAENSVMPQFEVERVKKWCQEIERSN